MQCVRGVALNHNSFKWKKQVYWSAREAVTEQLNYYVSQFTVETYCFSPCPCFLATPMCYIPFERVFDLD